MTDTVFRLASCSAAGCPPFGALIVGALCGDAGMKKVEPFFVTPFQGVLALFLLEMGVVAGG